MTKNTFQIVKLSELIEQIRYEDVGKQLPQKNGKKLNERKEKQIQHSNEMKPKIATHWWEYIVTQKCRALKVDIVRGVCVCVLISISFFPVERKRHTIITFFSFVALISSVAYFRLR